MVALLKHHYDIYVEERSDYQDIPAHQLWQCQMELKRRENDREADHQGKGLEKKNFLNYELINKCRFSRAESLEAIIGGWFPGRDNQPFFLTEPSDKDFRASEKTTTASC